MRDVILKSRQCPGDITVLSAVLRDMHAAYPGQFRIDVRTTAEAIWENNPYITKLREGDPGVESIEMQYPLIHQSQRPYHFLHGYPMFLEQKLGLRIPVTKFSGDIHLSALEKATPPVNGQTLPEWYWIMVAGGKTDYSAKWGNPATNQQIVDHFRGRLQFVQVGEAGHWHPRLRGVLDLVGKTSLREFIRLMYYAAGVVCPVTFAMHLAAAVETPPGRPKHRACVVLAGGREPPHWEAYPHHQFISNVGMLPCCADGACWKSRCQLIGDGDEKDRHNVCEQRVQVTDDLWIAKCQMMITAADVIRRIEMYLEGGLFAHTNELANAATVMASLPVIHLTETQTTIEKVTQESTIAPPVEAIQVPQVRLAVLIEFDHGLGDGVQLTVVLLHLRRAHPDWDIDVVSLRGKHSAFTGLCRRSVVLPDDTFRRSDYQLRYTLDWHECRTDDGQWPSTKATRCLQEVFKLLPQPDLCHYEIQIDDDTRQQARDYLESLCGPPNDSGRYRSVLIHYQGNTSEDKKNLSHELIREVCGVILSSGHVPVILDWDRRSPLPDGVQVHCPHSDHPLWRNTGTGDAAMIAAMTEASSLMIGIDSGPLHAAGATSTPTLAVWTQHHPVHFFDLADNVVHLVPRNHSRLANGRAAAAYFEGHYQHRTYDTLEVDLPSEVEIRLTGGDRATTANRWFLRQLRATGFTADYYEEHKQAGLDYLGFGEWQQQYGRWLVQSLDWTGQRVLDVGCACGSIVRGLGEAGAVVQGVDLCEPMIQLGRQKWPDMAGLLFVCDAVNLHLFADASWNGLHSAQSAEHWKPELVPFILRELARISTPGSLFFCALDTEELFARQGRTLEHEDPTHVCIYPLSWWHERLAETGWQVCTTEFQSPLQSHQESFLRRYDWDWFVARREA